MLQNTHDKHAAVGHVTIRAFEQTADEPTVQPTLVRELWERLAKLQPRHTMYASGAVVLVMLGLIGIVAMHAVSQRKAVSTDSPGTLDQITKLDKPITPMVTPAPLPTPKPAPAPKPKPTPLPPPSLPPVAGEENNHHISVGSGGRRGGGEGRGRWCAG